MTTTKSKQELLNELLIARAAEIKNKKKKKRLIKKKRYFKQCRRCNDFFHTSCKFGRVCNKCLIKSRKQTTKKIREVLKKKKEEE